MKLRIANVVLCLVAVLGLSSVSKAVLLSELIRGNGSVESGDKLFQGFTYVPTGQSPPSADSIEVVPIQDAEGNYGIRLAGPFVDLPGGGGSDSLVGFTVSVTDPGRWISDVHLRANGTVNNGEGLFQVTETAVVPGGNQIKLSVIEQSIPDGNGGFYVASKDLDWKDLETPVKSLRVEKDILLMATGQRAVTMSFVDQTFSQIPEPASLGMLVAGVAGLFAARRKS